MSPRDKTLISVAEGILRDKPDVEGLLKWIVLIDRSTTTVVTRISIP